MEIIELSGYTHEEKLQIAKRHLIKQEMEKHGVSEEDAEISDEVIQEIIEKYTREAGVRGLKRQMAAVARYVAVQIAKKLEEKVTVTSDKLEEILGPQKFENEIAERTSKTGVATGLAWTAVGGDLLFIESSLFPFIPEVISVSMYPGATQFTVIFDFPNSRERDLVNPSIPAFDAA